LTPKLPKSLAREPLVDAVFEVRLNGTPSLADILPGFLFHDLDPKPKVIRLPAAEIPLPMRAADPGLQFAPVLRLEWGQYFISVGDRNIVISCKLPYPKWPNFKEAILDIMGRIAKVGIEGQVERYSVKYVNLILGRTLAEQIAKIRMSIRLGADEVSADQVSLQVHKNEGDILHILSVIIGAEGQLPDGNRVQGAVVDIDSIRAIGAQNFEVFSQSLGQGIEELRQTNKAKFFGCLTEIAIEEMGPTYE
jgi:uncharacterized protein (TIGR04255 family)